MRKNTGNVTTTYTYYIDGLRKSKKIGTGETKYFIWSNGNMVYEFTATDDTTYFFGLHLVSSDDYRYVLNAHGDVVALVNANGNVVRRYEYDAFGVELNPDENDENPYRYCAEYFDVESGTIYLRARYYSPNHGRFTQIDPARDGLNWYAYCANNPVSRIDPSGMLSIPKVQPVGGPALSSPKDKWRAVGKIINAQKAAQRAVWKAGAEIYLREKKGFDVSAMLLEHACQDDPKDLSFGNDSTIASLIKNDPAFSEELNKVMSNNSDNLSFSENEAHLISFEGGTDLYYSLHTCSVTFSSVKQSDGSWTVSVHVYDRYDYTEFTTAMGGNGISLGTIANDAAHVSQLTGALTEYDITIDFEVTYK